MDMKPTPRGVATGLLIYEVLRVHGQLIAAGDRLMADLGLTSARWQVLGTVAACGTPLTVPDLARILGQSRQSIQRLVNEMESGGLVQFTPNPGHKRSAFVTPTGAALRLHAKAEERRIPWTEEIAARLSGIDVNQACRALSSLRKTLERE